MFWVVCLTRRWNFNSSMQFQKIKPFHKDKDHWANKGFIHLDGNSLLAGLVYLNKNPDPDSGTSFFRVKRKSNIHLITTLNFHCAEVKWIPTMLLNL